jgi:SAM-dependent methyltransferase
MVLKEYQFEKKHGIKHIINLQQEAEHGDEPISYANLMKMFERLNMGPNDVFVDFGCGQGRVVCFAALQNVKKVVGVEPMKKFADNARENIKSLMPKPAMPVEIVQGDPGSVKVDDGTVYYFRNPPTIQTFKSIVSNIRESLKTKPRLIRIVYIHPMYEWLLNETGWMEKEMNITSNSAVERLPVTMALWRNLPGYNYRSEDIKKNAQLAVEQPVL